MAAFFLFSACAPAHKSEVDRLNDLSYAFHYRNLDSTKIYAQKALLLSDDYDAGYAEACNNLAFVCMARMEYAQAKKWLNSIEQRTDNQIELLVADVQHMRLCQRMSRNKDFYTYRERARLRLRRIGEEMANLPQRDMQRMVYARSEFDIVVATYFYYVGLDAPMQKALADLQEEELEGDTAQYLNYLYNIGSGGALTQGSVEEINQTEFDYLARCLMMASEGNYPYWQANALQALSEHLQNTNIRNFLIKNNLPAINFLNSEQMPDSLLAGNFAQRALNLFMSYGDVYQTAGSYRTLAECYWAIGDYLSAGDCLHRALGVSKSIDSVPELVASIREQLSLVYSAMDDKPVSDYNRNIYLDLQEQTRQDRQLEARAAQLDESAAQLNWMIAAVVMMIVFVVGLLFLFDRMRKRKDKKTPISRLLDPLEEWKTRNEERIAELVDRREEIEEQYNLTKLHVAENKRRNLEQRAKISLVNTITPFIDRMINEVNRLVAGGESDEVRQERYQYISELTDKINQYNDVLTQWIQMRQGTLSLHIESFALQPLFDIVQKGKMSFLMRGITLEINPTEAVVKADRILTLFMINTIADNARKFTEKGGRVRICATEKENSVEVSIKDTGKGMTEEQLTHVFDRTYTGGHGFGLLNCKGIIEKYKKVSNIFAECDIHVESEKGKGSQFTFRLPKGVRRMMMILWIIGLSHIGMSPAMAKSSKVHHQHVGTTNLASDELMKADAFADSAYFSNVNGDYERTIFFADSSRYYLNRHYLRTHPNGKNLMVRSPKEGIPAELQWYHDSIVTNYDVILDLRNESAVAALALHRWALYQTNNKVYTQLFRELSADNTLSTYVRTMQLSENSKMVAVILLVLLLMLLIPAYYFLYFRHVLSYRFAVEKVNAINKVLLSEDSDEEKLQRIQQLWGKNGVMSGRQQMLLGKVVQQIEDALSQSITHSLRENMSIEMAEDELHRAEYENGKLHVSNSVLDNCLSTLKHETMYYPSRIRQVIENNPSDVAGLMELVDYYKSLYTMLSTQAMQQVKDNVKYDSEMLYYLFEILKKEGGQKGHLSVEEQQKDDRYMVYRVLLPSLTLTADQCVNLFTPLTHNLQFLLCRQIVREVGEVTNMRGCGITALPVVQGIAVEVVLPKKLGYSKL